MRYLGNRLAWHLNISFFDIHDTSAHHCIRHRCKLDSAQPTPTDHFLQLPTTANSTRPTRVTDDTHEGVATSVVKTDDDNETESKSTAAESRICATSS